MRSDKLTGPDEHHHHRRAPATRGRAQDSSRDRLIIDAALDLLVERGFNALTMSDVAARAGVSKATLYRRWGAKEDLVADAFASINHTASPDYPGISLRDDLLALVVQASTSSKRHQVAIAAMEAARSSPELGAVMRSRFVTYVRKELMVLAERYPQADAVKSRSLAIDYMTDTTVSLLIYYSGPAPEAITHEHFAGMVDYVLLPLMTTQRLSIAVDT